MESTFLNLAFSRICVLKIIVLRTYLFSSLIFILLLSKLHHIFHIRILHNFVFIFAFSVLFESIFSLLYRFQFYIGSVISLICVCVFWCVELISLAFQVFGFTYSKAFPVDTILIEVSEMLQTQDIFNLIPFPRSQSFYALVNARCVSVLFVFLLFFFSSYLKIIRWLCWKSEWRKRNVRICVVYFMSKNDFVDDFCCFSIEF